MLLTPVTLRRRLSVALPLSELKLWRNPGAQMMICITCLPPRCDRSHYLRKPHEIRAWNDQGSARRHSLCKLGRPESAVSGVPWPLCQRIARSGDRQEVDWIDDRHGDDVFLGAEIEVGDPVDDLLREHRRAHIGKLQLAQRDGAVRFDRQP